MQFENRIGIISKNYYKFNLIAHLNSVCGLFKNIETLARVLLVVPVTSCEVERSFSSLERLETYRRSSMTPGRLQFVILIRTK